MSYHVFPEPEYEFESPASRCKIRPSVTIFDTSNPISVIGSCKGKNFVRKQNNYQKKVDNPQNKFVMVVITKYLTDCNIKLYKKKAK